MGAAEVSEAMAFVPDGLSTFSNDNCMQPIKHNNHNFGPNDNNNQGNDHTNNHNNDHNNNTGHGWWYPVLVTFQTGHGSCYPFWCPRIAIDGKYVWWIHWTRIRIFTTPASPSAGLTLAEGGCPSRDEDSSTEDVGGSTTVTTATVTTVTTGNSATASSSLSTLSSFEVVDESYSYPASFLSIFEDEEDEDEEDDEVQEYEDEEDDEDEEDEYDYSLPEPVDSWHPSHWYVGGVSWSPAYPGRAWEEYWLEYEESDYHPPLYHPPF
jgi:hypothetical protein